MPNISEQERKKFVSKRQS